MNIAAWLEDLGMQQYEQAFRDNAIDDLVLRELTAEDLKDIGVGLVGHRRKLLGAIAALRDQPAARNPSAERRQLTIMFCDLVGSSALSANLDPEDLREIISAYQRAIATAVAEFDGFIARYMGDGVLVYFGYPKAHEDDAEQAIRAGLRAVDAVRRLDVGPTKLQARVGIATGLVVVGDLIGERCAQEQAVIGETPNLAANLQSLAEPGTVVIAPSTHRLVGNLFEYRELGALKVKGSASLVPVWQVRGPSAVASRFEALRGSTLAPLIGRDEDIDLLQRRWTSAKEGDGQVVLISGEPGIGKSRLLAEFERRLLPERHLRFGFFCSPYHQHSALFPFIEHLRRASGLSSEDSSEEKLGKLETLLHRANPSDEDIALLADLLSLPVSERYRLPDLSAKQQKERTLQALIRVGESLSRRRPIVAVFEDAHWMDPTSRELIDLAVKRVRNLPVLVVVTFRPEFQPLWVGQPRVTMMSLSRLDRRDRTKMVEQIAGNKALPMEVANQISDRTDGIPLFVEELTKSILESGFLREESGRYVLDRPLPPLAIPTTLHDSLMARLDRVASVRLVAQMGAAIGREFSYALLRAVSGIPEDDLLDALARLVESELVHQRGSPPEAAYTFKHALVQDAAHGSMLRSSRQQLHAQIASALETHSPELKESQPEIFARHFAEAGLIEHSAACWARAGQKSAARSAMAESAAQLQKALDQLELLPETPERRRQELDVYSSLGAALRFAKGPASPEMGRAFVRARELWESLGSPTEYLHIPYGQARYHVFLGELDLAQRLDEDLLQVSRQRGDAVGTLLGHDSSGRDLLLAGDFASARSHLEQVLALFQSLRPGSLVKQTGSYPQVISRGYLAIALFCMGFPARAMAESSAAVAEARELAHPPTLTVALSNDCRLLSLMGNIGALNQRTEQLIDVAMEQGFAMYRNVGTIYRGWAKVNTGEIAEGITLLRRGSDAYRDTGVKTRIPYHMGLLAKAHAVAGQYEEAALLLGEAVQMAERMGELWFASELYRYQGQLMARQGDSAAAEALYRKAFAIAQEQDARLWQLRAAVSLARLGRAHTGHSQARERLSSVYGWFSEGFDTADLRDAKVMLDELACAGST